VSHYKLIPHRVVQRLRYRQYHWDSAIKSSAELQWAQAVSSSGGQLRACCSRDQAFKRIVGQPAAAANARPASQPTFQLTPCPGMYSLQSVPYCLSGSSTPSSGYRCCSTMQHTHTQQGQSIVELPRTAAARVDGPPVPTFSSTKAAGCRPHFLLPSSHPAAPQPPWRRHLH
jgi:hypothetical protein